MIYDVNSPLFRSFLSQKGGSSDKRILNGNNTTSPYALHQQQLAMLAQQQYLLMAAAAKSGGLRNLVGNGQQQGSAGSATNASGQNWPNFGYQIPGMQMPAPGKVELDKYLQHVYNSFTAFWVYVQIAKSSCEFFSGSNIQVS
ncbi:putative ADP-ribosylation factor GTPase-activating protein AGD5/15 [Helianthus debilis subsp. tardiflorus]